MGSHHRSRHHSSWSDLPSELLASITDRLKSNPDDIHRLRSICKSWRSATAAPPLRLHPPLNLPQTQSYTCTNLHTQKQFTSTAVYLLRQQPDTTTTTTAKTTNTWLITVEQCDRCGTLRLLHPFTGNAFKPGRTRTLTNIGSAVEISKSLKPTAFNRSDVYKVILWADPYKSSSSSSLSLSFPDDYSYVVLHGREQSSGVLQCFRAMDNIQNNQHCIKQFSVYRYDDIVSWKGGLVYAVDRVGRLYALDYKSMEVAAILVGVSTPMRRERLGIRKQLMVWNGEMFMVQKKQNLIKMYKLNEDLYILEEVTSLVDRILFVRSDRCFMVRACDLRGCKGNRVVDILDKNKDPGSRRSNVPDDEQHSRLFEGAVGYVEVRVYKYGEGGNKFKLMSACPGFVDALWPPPSWVREDYMLMKY